MKKHVNGDDHGANHELFDSNTNHINSVGFESDAKMRENMSSIVLRERVQGPSALSKGQSRVFVFNHVSVSGDRRYVSRGGGQNYTFPFICTIMIASVSLGDRWHSVKMMVISENVISENVISKNVIFMSVNVITAVQ